MSIIEELQVHLHQLQEEKETSTGLWFEYWMCRKLLRELGMEQYKLVTATYIANGDDAWLPSEGFKDIAGDEVEMMRTVCGDIDF